MAPINVMQKFSLFTEQWTPKVIAELNGQAVKLAKVQGEFVWHDHAAEDELFLVFKGTLYIDFRDGSTVELNAGELYVVPRGVEHKPRTKDAMEVWLMLLEPVTTKHTGDVITERTVNDQETI